ncbi:DAK2 domain-containing protein [Streptomyces griseoviridis]|jgi:dihydroxyacetone kinase-like protein|uniref:Dihydroxyacetone kinase-like protein n=3 Tax=Streptomyces TaxID=1883 RepID=A0ABT9L759_STRGD|nr:MULTISPECIES: DAK2 domain-containing protein [Streptomyces]MDP9679541.1 dihydroxyacetone kinase-like protein [Streptomyces griseoviridis]GGS40413.1 dihydroxyacetone kinase subunit L [Streptomyces niveoruber]GGT00380.1 dihydroxyacetone kinase subunit L [Streptomyces griseoviridis]GGU24538.1 dihydroxyacetone kinase subunit L [Streptomyces daghestanicus]GHI29808.1 dihydroxyacetone kinase subunit L [Streptomyces daghestanicus]
MTVTVDQEKVLRIYAEAARTAHDRLTALDQLSGDGDFGDNLCAGLDGVEARLDEGFDQVPFTVAAQVFLDEVGGTSGPLMGLLFQEMGRALAAHGDGPEGWAAGVREGLAAIQRVGEAEPGDRTLVDALVPARDALDAGSGFADTARASLAGARATADIKARRGRASYLGERALGAPDPGAIGVALLFWSLARAAEPDTDLGPVTAVLDDPAAG